MKKDILILVIVNLVVLAIVYLITPQCEPCIEGAECPLCISGTQKVILAALLIFDVLYILKIFRNKK